jgi:hypothetical protein
VDDADVGPFRQVLSRRPKFWRREAGATLGSRLTNSARWVCSGVSPSRRRRSTARHRALTQCPRSGSPRVEPSANLHGGPAATSIFVDHSGDGTKEGQHGHATTLCRHHARPRRAWWHDARAAKPTSNPLTGEAHGQPAGNSHFHGEGHAQMFLARPTPMLFIVLRSWEPACRAPLPSRMRSWVWP